MCPSTLLKLISSIDHSGGAGAIGNGFGVHGDIPCALDRYAVSAPGRERWVKSRPALIVALSEFAGATDCSLLPGGASIWTISRPLARAPGVTRALRRGAFSLLAADVRLLRRVRDVNARSRGGRFVVEAGLKGPAVVWVHFVQLGIIIRSHFFHGGPSAANRAMKWGPESTSAHHPPSTPSRPAPAPRHTLTYRGEREESRCSKSGGCGTDKEGVGGVKGEIWGRMGGLFREWQPRCIDLY